MVLYALFVARNPELFYEKRNFEFPFKRNMLCACGVLMPLLTVFFPIFLSRAYAASRKRK